MIFFSKKQGAPVPPLTLTNTLSRTKETFAPIHPPHVTMYTCGPTVYDFAHIGNLRSYVFADTLKRTLLYNGFEVNHTINITDFGHLSGDGDDGEDKMMLALKREGKPRTMEAMKEIADRYTNAFVHDMDALHILPPTHYTRASEYIREEIALVQVLHEKGYTYETSDGIYFDISRFPAYGRLGNIDLTKLKEGARVEVHPEKRHPADFAVWKKGALGWDSIWGKGFPGWHIECTAMAFATLGKQIDIHTGGIDHIATHHNGEIAQAEAATGKSPYVRYWMHNAFITLEERRIGKSLGNAINLSQLADRGFQPLVYRYWLLTGHYSSPMNFTFDALEGAQHALVRLRRIVYGELGDTMGTSHTAYRERFLQAINDDLNTPVAIAIVWELIKDHAVSHADKRATIADFDRVLALGLGESPDSDVAQSARQLEVTPIEDTPPDVRKLIEERDVARKEKRWHDADILRQEINLKGYLLEDTPHGTKISRSRE